MKNMKGKKALKWSIGIIIFVIIAALAVYVGTHWGTVKNRIHEWSAPGQTEVVDSPVVKELKEQIAELEQRASLAEAGEKAKAQEVEEYKTQVAQVESDKRKLQSKLDINIQQMTALEAEKAELIVERDAYKNQTEQDAQTISTINARISEIEEELEGYETANAEFQQQISALQTDKETLTAQLNAAQTDLTSSQAEVAALTSQITELRSSLVYYIENGVTLDSEKYAVAKFIVGEELYGAQVLLKGSYVTVPEPTIKGYKFNGWYVEDVAVELSSYPINANTTFVANLTEYTLATATWQEIAVISESGNAQDYFAVGDTKTITLTTGETITVAIMGFNHDNLSDGTGKAGITFGMTGVLGTSNTSSGVKMHSSSEAVSWSNCDMRLTTLPSYYLRLSSELQEAIKSVDKKSCGLGKQIESTSDKLWLFSEVEISGKNDEQSIDEGTRYEYWRTIKDGSRYYNRVLKNSNNKSELWWVRSHDSYGSNTFSHCEANGYFNYSYNSDSLLCLCFGFCI